MVRFLAKEIDFSFPQSVQTGYGTNPTSRPMDTGSVFRGHKAAGA
jgi:hypothetical protein